MATAKTAPRKRAVNLSAELTRDQKIDNMRDNLRKIVELGKAESAARSAKERAIKALERSMGEEDIGSIQVSVDAVLYEGKIWAGDPSNVIDPAKLYELITPAQFISVVSVAAGTAKDVLGTNITNQALVEKHGEVKLRVGKVG